MITRQLINSDIKFVDIQNGRSTGYSYDDLSRHIDAYKNLLQKRYNCQPGNSVLIGVQASLTQTALVFACAELALTIVIADYNMDDVFADATYVDPKTKLLLPIDYFIVQEKNTVEVAKGKYQLFDHVAGTTICINNEDLDFTANNSVLATGDSIILRCTSSGTTGTPKIVTHNHRFMYHLILRNAAMFAGRAGLHHNLQHGSSFATYFLPILASKDITEFYSFRQKEEHIICLYDLDHLLLPYTNMIDQYFDKVVKQNTGLNIYTLSYIKASWLDQIKQGKAHDIVSIFGSNETSGPTFINKARPLEEFDPKRFTKLDDFYTFDFDVNGVITVHLPYYENVSICTNDRFRQENNHYYHEGRSDLIRINGLLIDLESYRDFGKNLLDCDLIYDTVYNEIYLAVWQNDQALDYRAELINNHLNIKSGGLHRVNKYKLLSYTDFQRGVKIDHELLRDYFRNYV